ncbi:hypothetical protein [Magnetospirillum fulvum]|nr:hypothetical protein [Magnetospirillum fulvum]
MEKLVRKTHDVVRVEMHRLAHACPVYDHGADYLDEVMPTPSGRDQ